jgi:hypothetical protein
MASKKVEPEKIAYSGLVFTPENLDEAFERAKSVLTQGQDNEYKINNLYVSDALMALQMIQNTLSQKYNVFSKVDK